TFAALAWLALVDGGLRFRAKKQLESCTRGRPCQIGSRPLELFRQPLIPFVVIECGEFRTHDDDVNVREAKQARVLDMLAAQRREQERGCLHSLMPWACSAGSILCWTRFKSARTAIG